ncbi:50S ribosomal protein L35 [Pseudalkalibacillus caeni]|uniref:Large ribosomal subunit protein bL35 n=1 Tax=Exobacillus caeni TaxID=2574798 RepID=A0A5R9F9G8_9BACL|nr:50S ribosomal protein L35 [Pseudalkalibacillus caeni]TLS39159.1 50S ribosomal protein L35 [Pseudalkalibacillus caeni]
MPKMKSHSGASKRFKRTGTGKLKRSRAYTSHMFRHKTEKQKRKLRKASLVSSGDFKRIKQLVYNKKK